MCRLREQYDQKPPPDALSSAVFVKLVKGYVMRYVIFLRAPKLACFDPEPFVIIRSYIKDSNVHRDA
jgi:hypothetical protein